MSTTTAAAVVTRTIAVIRGLVPTVLAGDEFREYRNEDDFIDAMEANPTGALRRFEVRDTEEDEEPDHSEVNIEEQVITIEVTVAYPHTARYGAEQALDRDDCMKADEELIVDAIGPRGRGNFSAVNGHPDACWIADGYEVTREEGEACDYLVIRQQMVIVIEP